jgi:hypothetical protein
MGMSNVLYLDKETQIQAPSCFTDFTASAAIGLPVRPILSQALRIRIRWQYDSEHCWTVRKLATDGRFPEEWFAEIGVTMRTPYNWAKT